MRETTKKGGERYQNLSKEEKKQQYAHQRYKNLSEGESNKVDKWIYKKML